MEKKMITDWSQGLTKFKKNLIFKIMKTNVISVITLIFLVSLLTSTLMEQGFSQGAPSLTAVRAPYPQSTKKPKYDYLSTVLSRDTKPLGLKEDVALKQFLKQPSIKWAIRAGERHILD